MKLKIALLSMVALGLIFSFAFAAGDVAKGKSLYNDPKFAGGTVGKSCNSCHPAGSIDPGKKEFMGGKAKSLEAAVNMCIEMMMKGKAIDPIGADMANIVAYIKSSKAKAPAAEMPKKKT